jgi:hypothetical protein
MVACGFRVGIEFGNSEMCREFALLVPGCNTLFKKLAGRAEMLHGYGKAQIMVKPIGCKDLRRVH